MSALTTDMPGVRPEEAARGGINREIEPPIELGLPYWFHLFFPDRLLTTDLRILVIGCEDGLAARLARANPKARVTVLESRPTELENTVRVREQSNLTNLELVSEWPSKSDSGEGLDLVYYNTQSWPGEPAAVLERAADLLRLKGSLHLTVRASYAWTGVRTVRELLERLGIQPDAEGYPRARQIVAALGRDHPWNLLGPDPNTRPDDLLADWLRPEESCFSVPEVYALLAGSGLALQRFTYQSYYLPQCSPLARTPLLAEVRQLPLEQQQSLMELYWPGARYHLVVACRPDRPAGAIDTDFSGKEWLHYAPLLPARLPLEEDASKTGGKARLCWRAAGMPEIGVSLGGFQYRLLQALDRAEELGDVVGLAGLSGDPQLRDEWARDFFRLMADYDFLHFRTCRVSGGSRAAARSTAEQPGALLSELEPLAGSLEELLPSAEPVAGAQRDAAPDQLPAQHAEPGQSPRRAEALEQPIATASAESGLRGESTGAESTRAESAEGTEAAEPDQDTSPAQHTGRALTQGGQRTAQAEGATQAEATTLATQFERVPYQACPLCSHADYQLFRRAEAEAPADNGFVRVPIAWMRCGRCGHLFTSGYFAGEPWQRILEASLGDRGSLRPALANRALAARIVATITTLRESASGRWLDAGCSHSGLAAVAAEFGYETVGVDCCRPAARRLSELGYDIRGGSLFDCGDGPYDVISLSGLLDHTPFPAQALRHVHGLLGPRGLLFVSGPSSDTLGWRNLDFEGVNPYWARLDRYHTFHRKSVFRLLEISGFEPCSYGAGAPEPVGMEIIACKR